MIPETAELSSSIISGSPIVALDTCTFANFKNSNAHKYHALFLDLKNQGVRFVVPDVCIGEAMGVFNDENLQVSRENRYDMWGRMAYWMHRYIWKEFPVFPTNTHLFRAARVFEKSTHPADVGRDIPFTAGYSRQLFKHFLEYAEAEKAGRNLPITRFDESLEPARQLWRKHCEDVREVAHDGRGSSGKYAGRKEDVAELKVKLQKYHDDVFSSSPPVSIKMDGILEYQAWLFLRNRESYNANSNRNENDGIDYNVLLQMILPAYVCSDDHFFVNYRENVSSFQRGWCITPTELSKTNGILPGLLWPQANVKHFETGQS